MPGDGHDERVPQCLADVDRPVRTEPGFRWADDPQPVVQQGDDVHRGRAFQVVHERQVQLARVEPLLEMAGVGGGNAQVDMRVLLRDGLHQRRHQQIDRAAPDLPRGSPRQSTFVPYISPSLLASSSSRSPSGPRK